MKRELFHFLQSIEPDTFGCKGDFPAFLERNCPRLTAVLTDAEETGVATSFEFLATPVGLEGLALDGAGGVADINSIHVYARGRGVLGNVLSVVAHEYKHVGQERIEPLIGAWSQLAKDLAQSLSTHEKKFRAHYPILHPVDYMSLGAVTEIDACSFDALIGAELFQAEIDMGRAGNRELRENCHWQARDWHNFFFQGAWTRSFDYRSHYARCVRETLRLLHEVDTMFGDRPKLEQVSLSTAAIQDMTSGIWSLLGQESPFMARQGRADIHEIKEWFRKCPMARQASDRYDGDAAVRWDQMTAVEPPPFSSRKVRPSSFVIG